MARWWDRPGRMEEDAAVLRGMVRVVCAAARDVINAARSERDNRPVVTCRERGA